MKKVVFLIAVLFVGTAFAQDNIDIGHIVGGGKMLGARTADNQTVVGVIGVDSDGNTSVQSLSGKTVDFPGNISTEGAIAFPAAPVLTPGATPFATPPATNLMTERYSQVAAAAPTASFVKLPASSGIVGQERSLVNPAANPIAIVPQGSDTINAGAAATPYACAAGKICDCVSPTSGKFYCGVK